MFWVGLITVCLASFGGELSFSPPPVRAPSGLIAEAGANKVYLEWNPNLEKDLAGYRVYRRLDKEKTFHCLTANPIKENEFIDKGLKNGVRVEYAVTAVLKNGKESEFSNIADVIVRAIKPPLINEGEALVEIPSFSPLRVPNALTIVFQNGNRIVFDKDLMRVRDWQTPDGTHLLYPFPYGNSIDITYMDEFGFPHPNPPSDKFPAEPPRITLDYTFGRVRAVWLGYEVADNRVSLHYRIPLNGPGVPPDADWDIWIWADVWETWYPIERNLWGVEYKGLARKLELKIPSYYKNGYSVCPNDGFGVNGSCDGAVTYELRWGNPYLLEVHWEKGKDTRGIGSPRSTAGFHPTMESMQVLPFIFINFPKGTLLLSPKRYYYAISYCLTNYAAQGKDGIWPNFTIDCATAGKRFSLETFEYLWTPDNSLLPPQKFIDASFYYRRRLANLYKLNPYLTCLDYAWDYWGPSPESVRGKTEKEAIDILLQWGREMAEKAKRLGADQLGGAHILWTSSPYTVPDEIRLEPNHPINKAISQMIKEFHKRGVRFGYWIRPEFVKTATANVLSNSFWTPYYGYVCQVYPPAIPILEKEGLKLIRNHKEWIRKSLSGNYPSNPPYHWTPMSLATGWYDEVVYKDLVMMKLLGYDSALQDGGFSCLSGVDYTTGEAVAIQPFYWRFYQDVYRLGLDINGECMIGWGNNNLPTPIEEDMKYLWAYVHSMYRGNREEGPLKWFSPEMRHRSHQLYEGCYMNLDSDPKHAEVARFAQQFLKANGHPDRVYLEGLRWDSEKKEWVWDNVWWEYKNGKRVRYPNYEEIFQGR
ncbi:MAG: fibronectin type III domain-containing protein [bacterium]